AEREAGIGGAGEGRISLDPQLVDDQDALREGPRQQAEGEARPRGLGRRILLEGEARPKREESGDTERDDLTRSADLVGQVEAEGPEFRRAERKADAEPAEDRHGPNAEDQVADVRASIQGEPFPDSEDLRSGRAGDASLGSSSTLTPRSPWSLPAWVARPSWIFAMRSPLRRAPTKTRVPLSIASKSASTCSRSTHSLWI